MINFFAIVIFIILGILWVIGPGLFVYGVLLFMLCHVPRNDQNRGVAQDLLYILLLPATGLFWLLFARGGVGVFDLGRLTALGLAGGMIAGIGRAVLLRADVESLRTIEVVRLMLALGAVIGVWFLE